MTAPGSVTPPAPGWWVKRSRVIFPLPRTLTLTGLAPFITGGIRPSGAALSLVGSAPTVTVAVAAPPPFDAVGAGNTATATATLSVSTSYSHTASGSNRGVTLAISFSAVGTTTTLATFVRSVTYGGNAMTELNRRSWGGLTMGSSGSGGTILFGLINPPTGAQTVAITVSHPTDTYTWDMAVNSVSYTGVSSFGTDFIASGTSAAPSHTVASATNRRISQVFGGEGDMSAYDKTQRYLSNTNNANIVFGSAVGAASVTFNATMVNGRWSSVAVELVP